MRSCRCRMTQRLSVLPAGNKFSTELSLIRYKKKQITKLTTKQIN